MRRVGGLRRKTRHKLKRNIKDKGKLSLKDYFQTFNIGERVVLKIQSIIQKGMSNPVYYGKSGIITGKRGRCYTISIKDQNKEKTLIVHPVHLKRL